MSNVVHFYKVVRCSARAREPTSWSVGLFLLCVVIVRHFCKYVPLTSGFQQRLTPLPIKWRKLESCAHVVVVCLLPLLSRKCSWPSLKVNCKKDERVVFEPCNSIFTVHSYYHKLFSAVPAIIRYPDLWKLSPPFICVLDGRWLGRPCCFLVGLSACCLLGTKQVQIQHMLYLLGS